MSITAPDQTDLDHAPVALDAALVPLVDRVRGVLDAIPLAVKREGLPLEAIRERLAGRKYGNAHVGELGKVLVRLGWERHRDWTVGASYGTRWYPPGHCPKSGYHSRQRLRELRPDLFPNRPGRAPQWLIDERRKAVSELQL